MFRCTYAEIRKMKMQMEQRDRHMGKAMFISRGTVTYLHIEFEKTQTKQKNKVVINMEQTAKHAASETQIDRHVEKEAHTHDTNS